MFITVVAFVSLLLLTGLGWLVWRLWKSKRGNALSRLLKRDAGAVELSGIESLRSNFEAGIEKLRKANKNVYEMPWFLLAGQSGAGKTEAIRRSHAKEDFPAGLNDLMQGAGGTLNMNWWFTNKGIILDTAGRIFEEKVQAGQSSEWQEFLGMLKKSRKNMPINGFILAIPADSLIRDSLAEIETKASHIAEQITLVQDKLGVRFPVFILITKADFIPGFREFVENVSEPRLQQQMLGWSNPKGLDEPFVPEQVDAYLEGVIGKLKKRRLAYMLDPRPTREKRLDDLDALFAFPNQLREAIPNLRRYLEVVFSLNPWSKKPLFIRGIYLTSSLQQGEALDQAIADVLGKDLREMSLSTFKKETPLFLRDAFFEKIYREHGLVTSAQQVKGATRRRVLLFGGICMVAILSILAAAWFGSRSFRQGIGDEYAHWSSAMDQYRESSLYAGQVGWNSPIVYDTGVVFKSAKDSAVEVVGENYNLPEFIEKLSEYTQAELEVPSVFRPMRFFDDFLTGDAFDRSRAFRRVFEDSVIIPVIVNAREKLRNESESSWNEDSIDGLQSVIQLQRLLNQKERAPNYSSLLWIELDRLFRFVADDDFGPQLEQAYQIFYNEYFIRDSGWPNERFSAHYAQVDDISDPRLAGIDHGLNLWIGQIGAVRESQEAKIELLSDKLRVLSELVQMEEKVLDVASSLDHSQVEGLERRLSEFSVELQELSINQETQFSFVSYYDFHVEGAKKNVNQQVGRLNVQIQASAIADEGSCVLGAAVLSRVEREQAELIRSFEQSVPNALKDQFVFADTHHLNDKIGLKARTELYRKFADFRQEMANLNLVSWKKGVPTLNRINRSYNDLVAILDTYSGIRSPEMSDLRSVASEDLKNAHSRLFMHYKRSLGGDLRQLIGFPVFADASHSMEIEDIGTLEETVSSVLADAKTLRQGLNNQFAAQFDGIEQSLSNIGQFVSAHLSEEVLSSEIRVSFPPVDQIKVRRPSSSILWRARLVQLGEMGEPVRMQADSSDLGTMPLNEEVMEILFTSTVDGRAGDIGRVQVDGGWAPLRFLLSQEGLVKTLGKSNYRVFGEVSVSGAGGGRLSYCIDYQCPLPMAPVSKWLYSSELNSF